MTLNVGLKLGLLFSLIYLSVLTSIADGKFPEEVLLADVNDDGVIDLLATDPEVNETAGSIYIFYGPLNGTYSTDEADVIITGPRSFGSSLEVLNASNSSYLAVGAPADRNGSGAIYLFHSINNRTASDADEVAIGSLSWPGMGAIMKIGDFDADGQDEIASSCIYEEEPPGLLGIYFDNLNLTGPHHLEIDNLISFDWSLGSPLGLDADTFSIRWSGLLLIPQEGEYTLRIESDDGARLWLDGSLVIDMWKDGGFNVGEITAVLWKGYHDLILEYYENRDRAFVHLNWTTPWGYSGPIEGSYLKPVSAGPIFIMDPALHIERSVYLWPRSVTFGSSMATGEIDSRSGDDLVIGAWSIGVVGVLQGGDEESVAGDVHTVICRPLKKGDGDETGEDIEDLRYDDDTYYQVRRRNDVDDLEIDSFDVSSLDGEVLDVKLRVAYKTDSHYGDAGTRNYIEFALEESSYANTGIRPIKTVDEFTETYDLYKRGVRTIQDIAHLNIHFENGDGGLLPDSIYFDYIYLEVKVRRPHLNLSISGPPSFGYSLAVREDTVFAGAPMTGPIDLNLLNHMEEGEVFVIGPDEWVSDPLDLTCIHGVPFSHLGSRLAASDHVLAVAPDYAYAIPRGAAFLMDDTYLSGIAFGPENSWAGSIDILGETVALAVPDEGSAIISRIVTPHRIQIEQEIITPPGLLETVFTLRSRRNETVELMALVPWDWNATVNGNTTYSLNVSYGQKVVISLEIQIPDSAFGRWPCALLARSEDGVRLSVAQFDVVVDRPYLDLVDVIVQRSDFSVIESPRHAVEGDLSYLSALIFSAGAPSPNTLVEMNTSDGNMSRLFDVPGAGRVRTGSRLMGIPFAEEIWNASEQAGVYRNTTSLSRKHYSWRVIVRGDAVEDAAGSVRLKFYTPVDLLFDEVFMAVISDDTRDVIKDTWTRVTFDGDWYYEAAAGETFTSDWIDFEVRPGVNLSVTFHTQTQGANGITYYYGNPGPFLYLRYDDYRGDWNWSDNSPHEYSAIPYLLSIEARFYPLFSLLTSSAMRTSGTWTHIYWNATEPEGTEVFVAIRTAKDVGGYPYNWTSWTGSEGEYYDSPGEIYSEGQWIQYMVYLVSLTGSSTPFLEDITLLSDAGKIEQTEWMHANTTVYSDGSYWNAFDLLAVRFPWIPTAGVHEVKACVQNSSIQKRVEVKNATPVGHFHIVGYVSDTDGSPASGAMVRASNMRTGEMLKTIANGSGFFLLNLTLLPSRFLDGDLIRITAEFKAGTAYEEVKAYSEDAAAMVNLTIEMETFDIEIVPQTGRFGTRYIRMFRTTDGKETDIVVEGETTTLKVLVRNRGCLRARDVRLRFYANGTPIGDAYTPALDPGEYWNVSQDWEPSAGVYELSVYAYGMWYETDLFYADLWDAPRDDWPPVDFTSGCYNTPYNYNTFGINESDPWLSFDGWDWKAGAYGAEDTVHLRFGDPDGDSDYQSYGRVEIKIGGPGIGQLDGISSGAWGVQFYIDEEAFGAWNGTGKAYVRFTYTFDNFDDDLEENACILARLIHGNQTLWLGTDVNPFDPANKSIWRKLYKGSETFNRRFSQEVTSFIDEQGHYYLDMGAKVEDTSWNSEGVGAYFDDVSVLFTMVHQDPYAPNDNAVLTDVQVLPSTPETPFNITGYVYDIHNLTPLSISVDVLDLENGWNASTASGTDGWYNLSVPPSNYTEGDRFMVRVDSTCWGRPYTGSTELYAYSYESPVRVDLGLKTFGLNLSSDRWKRTVVPGDTAIYIITVRSESNVKDRVYLNVTALDPGWDVVLSGPGVTGSGRRYRLWLSPWEEVQVTLNVTPPTDPGAVAAGKYRWYLKVSSSLSEAWDVLELLTEVVGLYDFEVEVPPNATALPGERVRIRMSVLNTGTMENAVNVSIIEISGPSDANLSAPLLVMDIGEKAELVLTVAVPEWPDENASAGRTLSVILHLVSAYNASFQKNVTVFVNVSSLHDIRFMGPERVTAYPGMPSRCLVNVTNAGNGREVVHLAYVWNASLGNVSGPTDLSIDPGECVTVNISFTPLSDFSISWAGRQIPVTVITPWGNHTFLYVLGLAHNLSLTMPAEMVVMRGECRSFQIVLMNRGNGPATYIMNVSGFVGASIYPPIIEVDQNGTARSILYVSGIFPGTHEIAITASSGDYTSVIGGRIYVGFEDVSLMYGKPLRVTAHHVNRVFGDPRNTSVYGYISEGYVHVITPVGNYTFGSGGVTDADLAMCGEPYLLYAENGSIWLVAVYNETVRAVGTGTYPRLASSEYGVYAVYITSDGVAFRSLTTEGWSDLETIWEGQAMCLDVDAESYNVHIVWSDRSGRIRHVVTSIIGALRSQVETVAESKGTESIAVGVHAGIVHLIWSDGDQVFRTQREEGWTDFTRMGVGQVVSVSAGDEVLIARAWHTGIYVNATAGTWKAMGSSADSINIAQEEGRCLLLTSSDGLWRSLVRVPLRVRWSTTEEVNVTLENPTPYPREIEIQGMSTGDWSGGGTGVTLPPNSSIHARAWVRAPSAYSEDREGVVRLTAGDYAFMDLPVFAVGAPRRGVDLSIHDTILEPGRQEHVVIVLSNTGNLPLNLTLSLIVPENWTAYPDTSHVEIQVGDTEDVQIEITPWIGAIGTYDLIVNLTDQDFTTEKHLQVEVMAVPPIIRIDRPENLTTLVNVTFFASVLRAESAIWILSDGRTFTGLSASLSFCHPGNYTFTIGAENLAGTSTLMIDFAVENRPPSVAIEMDAGRTETGMEVVMWAIASDPDGEVVKCIWDFGDGHTSEGISVVHSYVRAGVYTVKLTVVDDHNGTNVTEEKIVVLGKKAGEQPDYMLYANIAAFGALLSVLCAGLYHRFKRRPAPAVKGLEDASTFESVTALWDQYMDVVTDLNPQAGRILRSARPLHFDEETQILTIGVEDGEHVRGALMPDMLSTFEAGLEDLLGRKILVFVEIKPPGEMRGVRRRPKIRRRKGGKRQAVSRSTRRGQEASHRQRATHSLVTRKRRRGGGTVSHADLVRSESGSGIGWTARRKHDNRRSLHDSRASRTSLRSEHDCRISNAIDWRRSGGKECDDISPQADKGSRRGSRSLLICTIMFISLMTLIPKAIADVSLDTADVDSDGIDEVIVGHPDLDLVAVHYGPLERGNLSYTDAQILAGPHDSCYGYALTYIESEELLAIAVPDHGKIYLYSNVSRLPYHYDNWSSYDRAFSVIPAGPQAMTAGDYDGDGHDDLVVGTGEIVRIYYGPLTSSSRTWDISGPDSAEFGYAVHLSDLDGDGDDDLLVGDPSNDLVYLFQGGIDYRSYAVYYGPDDFKSGTSVDLRSEDGLELDYNTVVSNGDFESEFDGWVFKANRNGDKGGTLRLIHEPTGDWSVGEESGPPTGGFGSDQNVLNPYEQATRKYTGLLASPSFRIPPYIDYIHIWYRWKLRRFERRDGAYLNLYNADNDQRIYTFDSQIVSGSQPRNRERTASRVFDISGFHNYRVYVGGELVGNDGQDAALIQIDDIYLCDEEGNIARKWSGYYVSGVKSVPFDVKAVLPVWDASRNGETMVVRIRNDLNTRWEDAPVAKNREVLVFDTANDIIQFNVSMSTSRIGHTPVLRSIAIHAFSDVPVSFHGGGGSRFGASVYAVSGSNCTVLVGAPAYYLRGAAFLFSDLPHNSFSYRNASLTIEATSFHTDFGASVALCDADGDGDIEAAVGAPKGDYRSSLGGSVYVFDTNTSRADEDDAIMAMHGKDGLGRQIVSSTYLVLAANHSAFLARGYHAFDLTAHDASALPGTSTEMSVTIRNLGDDEIAHLYAVVPDGWAFRFLFENRTIEDLEMDENETAYLSLEVIVPADARSGYHVISIEVLGDDLVTYVRARPTIRVFIPDLAPVALYFYRGDGLNVTEDSRHLAEGDESTCVVKFYTDSEYKLPEVNVTFYDTFQGKTKLIGNVTARPVINGCTYVGVTWIAQGAGDHLIRAFVDSTDDVIETDGMNNNLTYQMTFIDSEPDRAFTVHGTIYDTNWSMPVEARIAVLNPESGSQINTTSSGDGNFTVVIPVKDYREGDLIWVNASLEGAPGNASVSFKAYSEDISRTVEAVIHVHGVDLAFLTIDDGTGEVNISVLRYGDLHPTSIVIENRTSMLHVRIRNRGDADAINWTLDFIDGSDLVGHLVLDLPAFGTGDFYINWTPQVGTHMLKALANATADIYSGNNIVIRLGVLCLPIDPSTGVWVNGTVYDIHGAPLPDASVPVHNVDANWTNVTYTSSDGTFSCFVNSSDYQQGDRIDLNVTDGIYWGNETICLYSYDTIDLEIMLRRYGVVLESQKSNLTVMPWESAEYKITVVSDANFQDTFLLDFQDVPKDWKMVVAGPGRWHRSTYAIDIEPYGRAQLTVTLKPILLPKQIPPAELTFWITASMSSNPQVYDTLELHMSVREFYNVTLRSDVNLSWVLPGESCVFNVTLINDGNVNNSVAIYVYHDDLDWNVWTPSLVNLQIGTSAELQIKMLAPPAGPERPAGTKEVFNLVGVPLSDPSSAGGIYLSVELLPEVAAMWGGQIENSGVPGKTTIFALVLTNTGNTPANFTLSAHAPYMTCRLAPNTTHLDPGRTTNVSLICQVDDDPLSLPIGSNIGITINADPGNATVVLNLTVLRYVKVALSCLETEYWSLPGNTVIFDITVENLGNAREVIHLQGPAGENASWASLNRTSLTLDPGASAMIRVSVTSNGPGICLFAVMALVDQHHSNVLEFTCHFTRLTDTLLLHGAPRAWGSDVLEFAVSPHFVIWSDGSVVSLSDVEGSGTHMLGYGIMPRISEFNDRVSATWFNNSAGAIVYGTYPDWNEEFVTHEEPLNLACLALDAPVVAWHNGSALKVAIGQNWTVTEYDLPPDFRLLYWNGGAYLVAWPVNGSTVMVDLMNDEREILSLQCVMNVQVGDQIVILGRDRGNTTLLMGRPGMWSSRRVNADSIGLFSSRLVTICRSPGIVFNDLETGTVMRIPLRSYWSRLTPDGNVTMPLEPSETSPLYFTGEYLIYESRKTLISMPFAPYVNFTDRAELKAFVLLPRGNMTLDATLPGGWTATGTPPSSTGEMTITLDPVNATAWEIYVLRLRLVSEDGGTSNDLIYLLATEPSFEIYASVLTPVMPGFSTEMTLIVSNNGTAPCDLHVEVSLPAGWNCDLQGNVYLHPHDSILLNATITAPMTDVAPVAKIYLNGSHGHTVIMQELAILTPIPPAEFVVSTNTSFTFEQMTFTGPEIFVDNWTWYFGDGMIAYRRDVTHVYTRPGMYNVTLITENPAGVSTCTTVIQILNRPPIPQATYYSPVVLGKDTVLSAEASYDPDGTIVSYIWRFEDGSIAYGSRIHHHFDRPGTWWVNLTVVDDAGGSNSTLLRLKVREEEWLAQDITDIIILIGLISATAALLHLLFISPRRRRGEERAKLAEAERPAKDRVTAKRLQVRERPAGRGRPKKRKKVKRRARPETREKVIEKVSEDEVRIIEIGKERVVPAGEELAEHSGKTVSRPSEEVFRGLAEKTAEPAAKFQEVAGMLEEMRRVGPEDEEILSEDEIIRSIREMDELLAKLGKEIDRRMEKKEK